MKGLGFRDTTRNNGETNEKVIEDDLEAGMVVHGD